MKYIIVLGDGMADRKMENLGDKTCLEASDTPTLDSLAPKSEVGLCKTVPDGMKPASDVANMSVMGFDPKKYYTGRSPLEAVSMGIELKDTDVTLRCNLVTLSENEPYDKKIMLDYSAGEISTAEAEELINFLQSRLGNENFRLYAGIAYRHCAVVNRGITGHNLTPPHDILDRCIETYLPEGVNGKKYLSLMRESYELLKNHPVNVKRVSQGKKPANSIWLWGEGTKPSLDSFESLRRLKGGVISAVDLIKGIGIVAGMRIIDVKGATGDWRTNFKAKAEACLNALKDGLDFVYIHMEAPDECGHQGDIEHKIYSIESIDNLVVKTLCESLESAGEQFAILVLPDHPTPVACRTHTSDPVPYLLYTNKKGYNLANGAMRYTESEAGKTGTYVGVGHKLIEKLFSIK